MKAIALIIAKLEYGDKYFFTDGRHRTVNAKFLKMESMRCLVSEYILDEETHSKNKVEYSKPSRTNMFRFSMCLS